MATTAPMVMVQQSPQEKRRQALAASMINQGMQYRPMRTGYEALGNIAQTMMGAYLGKKADESYAGRREGARETFAEALANYSNPPAPYDSGYSAMTGTLGQNPDTADLAAQMELNKITGQQEMLMKPPNLVQTYDPNTGMMKYTPESKAAGMYGKPPSGGTKIDYTPEGGFSLSMGGPGGYGAMSGPGVEATKATINKVQGKLFDAQENYQNLNYIKEMYEPRFSEVGTRLGTNWTGLKAKWGMGEVSPEDRKLLNDYRDWQSASLSSMNEYIKSITGAAMSEPEAKRILSAMPNPGQGMFDGDDPISFEAKLNSQITKVGLAIARYRYANQNGLNWQHMPLYKMKDVIHNRGVEINDALMKDGVQGEDLDRRRRELLKQEFLI